MFISAKRGIDLQEGSVKGRELVRVLIGVGEELSFEEIDAASEDKCRSKHS